MSSRICYPYARRSVSARYAPSTILADRKVDLKTLDDLPCTPSLPPEHPFRFILHACYAVDCFLMLCCALCLYACVSNREGIRVGGQTCSLARLACLRICHVNLDEVLMFLSFRLVYDLCAVVQLSVVDLDAHFGLATIGQPTVLQL
jgi:hypothetical protein